MRKGTDISVSIASWNTRELTKQCIKSIKKELKGKSLEIIVVDNNSKDGSAEMVEKEFPEALLIKNKENLGFGKAHNQAIRKSKGKYVMIVNSDVKVLSSDIKAMVKFLDSNSKAGAASCKILNEDLSVQKNCSPFPTLANEFGARIPFANRLLAKDSCGYREIEEIENFSGSCYLVKKQAIKDTGMFDESFFAYVEETDWFYRMKKKGWKLYFFPGVKAIHYGGKSTKDSLKKKEMQYKNLLKFFEKHHGNAKTTALKAAVSLSNLAEVAFFPVSYLSDKEKAREKAGLSLKLLKINFGGNK